MEKIRSTLSDACFLVTDGTHDTPKTLESGIPFIKAKEIVGEIIDFENCEYISYEDHLKVIARSKPEKGDTLFAHIGASLGEAAFIKTNIEFSIKNIALFKPNSSKIDNRYLFYYIISPKFQGEIKSRRTGSAQPFVSLEFLRNHPIEYHHNVNTQRKIATILSVYDDLIENNHRRIKILEKMAQMIYREWFVNFCFPGHEKVKMVKSEMGMIPEGWEVVNFSELYMTSSGGTPSRKVAGYYGGAHPWIKTRELNDGFILETEETITDFGMQKSSAKLFPENTVILAIYGATIGKLGILSMPAATNQACVAILPKEVEFGRAFAFLFLRENRDKLIGLGQGAAQQNISQVVLKNFPTLRPPVILMQELSVMVEPLLDNVRNLQQRNANLRRTRDLLLPKLISGEIDVEDLDINSGINNGHT